MKKKWKEKKEFLLSFLFCCDFGGKGGGRAVKVLSVVGC